MKKLSTSVFIALLAMNMNILKASNSPESETEPITPDPPVENAMNAQETDAMIKRYEEINSMNTKDMTFAERREIKNESKQINNDLKASGQNTGVYISSGAALIIIIILLIILL